jgi:hypothetical protein
LKPGWITVTGIADAAVRPDRQHSGEIQVLTLYAANEQEALSAGKEQFSGLQLAVLLKQGDPGTELT